MSDKKPPSYIPEIDIPGVDVPFNASPAPVPLPDDQKPDWCHRCKAVTGTDGNHHTGDPECVKCCAKKLWYR